MPKTILERREDMHMSQQDIATRLGVAISTWRRWEANNDASIMLDLSLQVLEQRFKAQPHASQLDRGQTAPGRPATSSRAAARNLDSESVYYFLPESSAPLLPEQRRALPVGTLVWMYGDRHSGWRPARLTAMSARSLGDPSIPDKEREPMPPVPAWLQPVIEACPITQAMRERVKARTAEGMFKVPITPGVVPVAAAPAWMLSQADAPNLR